jgi:HTH-type transcriptional regulator / antitoxin HigA
LDNFEIDKLLNSAFEDNTINLRQLFNQKLEEYDITRSKALTFLGIDKDVFEDIISGTAKQPNLIHVIKLAEFVGISLQQAVSAIMKEQSPEAIASLEKSRNAVFLLKYFDIKKLTSLGFIDKTADVNDITNRLLQFFGYKSISEFEVSQEAPLYSRTKAMFTDKMMKFWVDSAYSVFKNIDNPYEYNREALKDIIIKAKPYCQDVNNGLLTVCKALYHCGITVIAQELLPTTQVRGGTFLVNGKPCIVLTDYRKSYPTVWTTLMHELHHVLYDLEVIEKTKFHLTDEGKPDLFLIEDKANEFGMNYFCDIDKYNFIKHHIHNKYQVDRFAKQLQVHPSMIYNAYQFYQHKLHAKNYWAAFKEEIPKNRPALEKLNPVTWKEESIKQIAEQLKTVFEIN